MAETKSPRIPSEIEKVLTKQSEIDKSRVLEKALVLAGNKNEVELPDISAAYQEILQGKDNKGTSFSGILKESLRAIISPISGVTIICAVLAVVFGYLGLRQDGAQNGFLDIAKIFAGAIVGSGIVSAQKKDC